MHPVLSRILSRLLIDRRDGHRQQVIEEFRDKVRFDFLSKNLREEYRLGKLAALLNHARCHVPFYRDIMKEHDVVSAASAMDILATLPVIQRSDLQKNPDAFKADLQGEVYPDATGGSTGTPLRFVVDRVTQRARESSLYWADSLAGWRYGERIAMLWGSDKDVASASRKARVSMRWIIDNRRWYNAFNMGEDRMEEFHRALSRFRPHVLVAYAGSTEVYARYLRSKNIRPDYPLRAIICSAEVLTPQARQTITEVFGCPVHDRYGNREFGAIACECGKQEGMHINERDFILEVDSPNSVLSAGPLIVTYLHNLAMPFIRYNTGDLARLHTESACRCGRATRRISSVTGRMADTIRTRSGKLIHGEYFTHLFYSATAIREFQFVQVTLDHYRLLLVTDGKEAITSLDKIRRDILDEVGSDCRLDIEYVDAIPVLSSGKRKFTLSLLEQP